MSKGAISLIELAILTGIIIILITIFIASGTSSPTVTLVAESKIIVQHLRFAQTFALQRPISPQPSQNDKICAIGFRLEQGPPPRYFLFAKSTALDTDCDLQARTTPDSFLYDVNDLLLDEKGFFFRAPQERTAAYRFVSSTLSQVHPGLPLEVIYISPYLTTLIRSGPLTDTRGWITVSSTLPTTASTGKRIHFNSVGQIYIK